jgi:hypothetical protein
MRKLLNFILIIGFIGSLVYHLRATGPSTETQADADEHPAGRGQSSWVVLLIILQRS